MQYIVRMKNDPSRRRWAVREAVSLEAAITTINHARVTGSVGSKDVIDATFIGGAITVIADVHQLNSDNTPRQPYTEAY